MSKLFSPIKLGSLELVNRLVIPPMCQYSCETGTGIANYWHQMHYGNLAQSGAGLLIMEATAVQENGRISPEDLGIWNDEQAEVLAKLLKDIRSISEIKLGIQIAHAGRKASTQAPWCGGKYIAPNDGGWETVSASDVKFNQEQVRALSTEEVGQLKKDFVSAAVRAKNAGYDLIEIHGAHGYLLHQFLSPLSNKRDDQYGGFTENRMRLVLEIFEEVRKAVGTDIALGIRISGTDWVKGGWDIEQSILLCEKLKELGCDFIHVSSAGLSQKQEIPIGPNYQVPLATEIKNAVDMPVMAVGLITEPEQAEAIILTELADMVSVGRGVLFDPRWGWHAAHKLKTQVKIAPPYHRCEPHHVEDLFGSYFDTDNWR